MKRNIVAMKGIIHMLFQPVGPLSKELAHYDPIDKPILCYEQLLYLIALCVTILTKVIELFNVSASYWLRTIALVLVILVILLALFHLLVPPRLSASRLIFVITNIIWLLLLISSK